MLLNWSCSAIFSFLLPVPSFTSFNSVDLTTALHDDTRYNTRKSQAQHLCIVTIHGSQNKLRVRPSCYLNDFVPLKIK